MARPSLLSLAVLSSVALLGTGAALAQPDPVTARKEGLKRMQGHLEAINPVATAGGNVREMVPRTEDIVAFFSTFPSYFPPGSDNNGSKALPSVWAERPGFEAAAANAVTAAGALRTAAASGDAAATAQAARAMGGACGACHRNYRGR